MTGHGWKTWTTHKGNIRVCFKTWTDHKELQIMMHTRNFACFQLARHIVAQHLQQVPDSSCQEVGLKALTSSWAGDTRRMACIKEDATVMLSIFENISQNPR